MNTPAEFDVYTVVILRRPPGAPELPEEELEALQARHLAYRGELVRRGVVVANGPFDGQSDPSYRGMAIFACGAAEAARLSADDPSVVGRGGWRTTCWSGGSAPARSRSRSPIGRWATAGPCPPTDRGMPA